MDMQRKVELEERRSQYLQMKARELMNEEDGNKAEYVPQEKMRKKRLGSYDEFHEEELSHRKPNITPIAPISNKKNELKQPQVKPVVLPNKPPSVLPGSPVVVVIKKQSSAEDLDSSLPVKKPTKKNVAKLPMVVSSESEML